MNLKNAAQKMKSWAKDEKSQVVSETGLLTLGGIILVGGAVAIMAPGIKCDIKHKLSIWNAYALFFFRKFYALFLLLMNISTQRKLNFYD